MILEGKRIASMLCASCHFNPATNALTGHYMPEVIEFGKIYSANITQDKQYGIGKYTDGQLLYLLRTGIKPDGTFLPPYMPKFVHMSDKDLHGIIGWLRSDDPMVTAKNIPDTVSEPNFFAKFLCTIAFKPATYPENPIVAPDTNNLVAYGKYITIGKIECFGCHSKNFEGLNVQEPEKSEGFLAGGNPIPGEAGKLISSANLTPDPETGIGLWSENQFVKALKFGIRPDGRTNRLPMAPYAAMTDLEARSVFAYLNSLPPVKNKIAVN
jgi:hypothetical protein